MFYNHDRHTGERLIRLVNNRWLIIMFIFPGGRRVMAESWEGFGECKGTVYALEVGPLSIALSPLGANIPN